MKLFLKSIKRFFHKLRFRFKAAEYMRAAYLAPREIVLVTTRLEGKDNMLPVDWHMPVSYFPKLYCISLESNNFSARVIESQKCFCVNFMPAGLEEKILQAGRTSGTETDKFEMTGLKKIEAVKINTPVLADALGWIECELKEIKVTGDHTLFIGSVVYENVNMPAKKEKLYHITK